MEIITIRLRLEQLPEEIEKAEFDYQEHKATLNHQEDLKKNVLAMEKVKVDGSNAERETQAYASQEYKSFVGAIKDLAIETAKKGALYHKKQNEFEAMRSLNKNI